MDILENREAWAAEFRSGWLKHYEETGEVNWKLYNHPRNSAAPSGPGVDLSQSRLLLITTAGAYLNDEQEPFHEPDAYGVYTIRQFPSDTPPEKIAFSHTHYDHTAVNEDQQVLLPLGHLADMVDEGLIGELAPNIVSMMGYQPDVTLVIDETIPAVVAAAKQAEVQAALLVPA